MNSIVVAGVVASGITNRSNTNGTPVSNFEITEYKNRHIIAAWGVISDICQDLQIGDYVVISGRLVYCKDSAGKQFANIMALHIEHNKETEEPIKTITPKGVY